MTTEKKKKEKRNKMGRENDTVVNAFFCGHGLEGDQCQ